MMPLECCIETVCMGVQAAVLMMAFCEGGPPSSMRRAWASAPGKAILFGEHAVVYGKTAVAAALSDLRLHAHTSTRLDGRLVIELPDLPPPSSSSTSSLSSSSSSPPAIPPAAPPSAPSSSSPVSGVNQFSVPLASVVQRGLPLLRSSEASAQPEAVGNSGNTGERSSVVLPTPAVTSWLAELLASNHEQPAQGHTEEGRKALMAIIFLTISIVGDSALKDMGVTIVVRRGSLPIGAGLGSSAALSVACAAALYRLRQLCQEEQQTSAVQGAQQPLMVNGAGVDCDGAAIVPPVDVLSRINDLAYAAEVLLHGNPSGLDNTVSCLGSAIQYRKDTAPDTSPPPYPTAAAGDTGSASVPLHEQPPMGFGGRSGFSEVKGFPRGMRVLLTNTMVPRETRALVAAVRERLKQQPGPTTALLDGIGQISERFLQGLGPESASPPAAAGTPPLCGVDGLMRRNHRLLCELGVGHPKLDVVCQTSEAHGMAAKLTGAGGGGCAITLLPSLWEKEEALIQALEKEGFQCHRTVLGGYGVLWHQHTAPLDSA